MTEVNFPGARRSDMYIETEERPEPAAVATEAFEEPADPFVEPDEVQAAPVQAPKKDAPPVGQVEPAAKPDTDDEDAEPVAPAKDGFNGFLNRLFGGLFKLAPSAKELAEREMTASQGRFEDLIRQSTWTRAVGVLVANKKGTAGKTPASILLGGVLAAIRGGSVAILETSDDKGQLAYRAEGDPQLGMGELRCQHLERPHPVAAARLHRDADKLRFGDRVHAQVAAAADSGKRARCRFNRG